MKRILKTLSVILSMSILTVCLITAEAVFDDTKYVDAFRDEVIKGYLPQILDKAADDEEIEATIWIRYTESFDKTMYAADKVVNASKAFHYPRNEAFIKTLPEGVKVTFISNYAPVVDVKATKAQIYKIAEMKTVYDIWEGPCYFSIEPEPADYFSFNYARYIGAFSDYVIKGYLPQILEKAADDDEIDVIIWGKYAESFDKSKYAADKVEEACKDFYSQRNEDFIKTLPEDIKVTFIDEYAPAVGVTATKAQVYKIAESETVWDIWEGDKYSSYDGYSDFLSKNKYFKSTMIVDETATSYLENEFYKVYADHFGKYFHDEFSKAPPAGTIDKNLYKSIKMGIGEQYITVILHKYETVENIAKALKIQENSVTAICQSYPAAMIKIAPKDIDSILLNENVAAVYDAFPSATEPGIISDAILEETYSPSSADARTILRYTAKLDAAPDDISKGKKFFIMGDADFDGKITSSDARISLRIAAKLEKGKTYFKGAGGDVEFWDETYKKQ